LSKLGLPIYPGAVAAENGGYSASGKEGTSQMAVLTTTDSFDKVYDWYKARMPAGSEQMKVSSGSGSVATFVIGKQGDKEQKTVEITSDKDKTSIMLGSGLQH
jgi:hypothetical protein